MEDSKPGYAPLKLFGRVISNRRDELLLTVGLMIGLMVVSSLLIYLLEREAQPEAFSNVFSAMWWAVAALTTVGYGDVYPITVAGKVFAAFIAMCGIGMFALPAGILGGGFVEEIESVKEERRHRRTARLIREAFEVEHLISIARLKRTLGIDAPRKSVELASLQHQLEVSADDVIRAASQEGGLRIRNTHSHQDSRFEDLVVVERFRTDRPYGACLERDGGVVVLNSSASAEPAIGHFSETLASLLAASYLANEHFRSTALLRDMRANFSANELYVDESAEALPELRAFRDDVRRVCRKGGLAVVFFSAAKSRPDVTFATGGRKGELCYRHDTPTLDDLGGVERLVGALGPRLQDELGLGLAAEIPIDDEAPKRLCQFIRRETGADVITVRVNIKTLRWAEEDEYYRLLALLAEGIREHLVAG